jgi:hypothetical protein
MSDSPTPIITPRIFPELQREELERQLILAQAALYLAGMEATQSREYEVVMKRINAWELRAAPMAADATKRKLDRLQKPFSKEN